MLTFYGYPKCSTCRKAAKWLSERGIAFESIDITQQPPPASLLRMILKDDRYRLRSLFNTSGQLYRELNMKERLPSLDEDAAVDLLSRHGKLCKRPIVTDGKRATVGFDPAAFEDTWAAG